MPLSAALTAARWAGEMVLPELLASLRLALFWPELRTVALADMGRTQTGAGLIAMTPAWMWAHAD